MLNSPAEFSLRYGPWAVVTGASEGIGRAFAEQLAAKGLHLLVVARREAELQALADALHAMHGVTVQVLPADLASMAGQAAVIEAMISKDVGLLVAAAGFGTSGPFAGSDLVAESSMAAVNMTAVLGAVHALAPRLIARGRGGLVLMSSLVAMQGVPHAAHYAATKAYVQTLAEGLHLELKPLGVDVIASAPGPVRSGFALRANMVMGAAETPDTVARLTLNRLGRRMTVKPGWLSLLLHSAFIGLPRYWRARIMAMVMHGMTKHQDAQKARNTQNPGGRPA